MTFTMDYPGEKHGQSNKSKVGSKRRQDAEQMVRFVRDYQGIQRETTDLRLKRVAPLPGIGEKPALPHHSSEFSAIDETTNEDSAFTTTTYGSPRNYDMLQGHGFDLDDRLTHHTSDFKIKGDLRAGAPRGNFPRKMARRRFTERNGNRRLTADIRLPPLSMLQRDMGDMRHHNDRNRSELPSRPSAPSPSVTPPLPDGFHRTSSSQGSESPPIDFIDIH